MGRGDGLGVGIAVGTGEIVGVGVGAGVGTDVGSVADSVLTLATVTLASDEPSPAAAWMLVVRVVKSLVSVVSSEDDMSASLV